MKAGTTVGMARKTPERSKIARVAPVAFARRQRGDGEKPGDDSEAKPEEEDSTSLPDAPTTKAETITAEQAALKPAKKADTTTILPADQLAALLEQPEATPPPSEATVELRSRTATMVAAAPVGQPPAMPTAPAPVSVSMGGVEDPTNLPGPLEIPSGHPTDPASSPGRVPPGDSRSLRRGAEFALIYRLGTFVISRAGSVGTRGQWRVVEYPTSSSASHSYAKECSHFVSDGFSDYRD